jgi:hypothetical protein
MTRRSTLFILWNLQGLAALFWLALLPTDAEHGFSASRLALMGIMLTLTGLSATLTWFSHLADFAIPERIQTPLYLFSIIVTISAPAAILILRALGKTSGFTYTAYAERLAPITIWFALSALELAIFLAQTRDKRQGSKDKTRTTQHFLLLISYFLLALIAITIFISITKLGITRLNDGSWGGPTTPLLEWQILLALAVSLGATLLRSPKVELSDSKVAILVYLFTCLLWTSQPINPGYFATPPRAPNFEIYPFSDALIYAQYAQSALAGNGFMWPDVPTRPLYITFITWLHAIAGQDYNRVILLQTLVLAIFPVVLYLLGKELAGRSLGLGMALLAVFRDLTANVAAPFANNYTYTKLFFSEIPAALLISLFTLMAIRWMRQSKPPWYALLAGGILGLSSLIRLQSAVALVAVIPIGFFIVKNRPKWLAGSALMIVGVALALVPWLARNYRATGGLVLDNPISQTMVLARRWGGDNGNTLIPRLPGEGDAQYSSRMSGLALTSLRENPGRILGSAINHFLNNEISNLLVFPLRDQLNSPGELIWPEHAFWQTWMGQPAPGQIPVIAFYLVLLGLGLATVWYKNGLLGLLPLALTLVYNAWTALFLSSGDRFLVPVDWAVYLYLYLGLLTLANLVGNNGLGSRLNNGETDNGKTISASWRGLPLTAAIILLLGASIPLTESAFPQKYPPLNAPIVPSTEVILHGRAIYPRWYDAGEGEPGTAKLGYGVTNEARLVFFLAGEENTLVIFPLKTAPISFPNASDVMITGTQEDGFVRAQKIDGKSVEYTP